MKLLKKPLSTDEIRKHMDQDGYVSGIVEIELNDILDKNLDEFFDLLAIRLTDNELLMNISYDIVGHLENTLYIKVTGDASEIISFED